METETPSFVLGNNCSGFLRISVLERLYPEAANYWDKNWLRAKAEVAAGAFQGRLEGDLRTDEIAGFYKALLRLDSHLKGTAELAAMEAWLKIEMEGDGRGHLETCCRLRDDLVDGNTLEVRLHLDQTFLPPLLRQLGQVLAAFPVIGSPYD
jgi:hypothetical protein